MRTTLTGLGLLLGACAHRPPLVYPSAPLAAKGFDAAIIKRELRLEAFGAELLSHYSQRLLVLTPRGRARARVEIPLDPGESLAALEAVSFGERGEPRYLEDLDVLRAAGGVVFDVPGVETGHAIEYAYTIRGPLRSRRFRFDSDVPVVESALEIDAALAGVSLDAHGPRAPEPAGRRFVQLGLDPGAPSWIDVGFADAAEIQRAPAPLAPMAPPPPADPVTRWAELSRRIDEPPGEPLPPDRHAETVRRWHYEIEALIADRPPLDPARARRASEIYDARFGTADDRATLLLALLRGHGVPASAVFAASALLIEAGELLLDPGCLGCFVGALRPSLHGVEATVVHADGTLVPRRLLVEPAREEYHHRLRGAEALEIEDGQWSLAGPRAARIRARIADGAAPAEAVRAEYPSLGAGHIEVLRAEDREAPLHVLLESVALRAGAATLAAVLPLAVEGPARIEHEVQLAGATAPELARLEAPVRYRRSRAEKSEVTAILEHIECDGALDLAPLRAVPLR